PQVTRALKVFPASNRVPVARRIHSLAAVVRRGPEILGPEKLLAGLVNKHRVVRNRAPVIVEIMRTLGVRVVCAALSCQVAFVVDDEMVLVQVIVFTEIRTGVELDPRRIGTKAVAHDQMTDAAKEIGTRNLGARAVSGISGSHVWVIPKKLSNGNTPLRSRRPTTLAQHPRGVRILETVDRIAETDVVFPLQVGKLVIVVASSGAVRQNFVEISVGVMLKERITQRRITVSRSAQQLGHHCQRRKRDALIVHRLMITTVRSDEVREVEDVIEHCACMFSQWRSTRFN